MSAKAEKSGCWCIPLSGREAAAAAAKDDRASLKKGLSADDTGTPRAALAAALNGIGGVSNGMEPLGPNMDAVPPCRPASWILLRDPGPSIRESSRWSERLSNLESMRASSAMGGPVVEDARGESECADV